MDLNTRLEDDKFLFPEGRKNGTTMGVLVKSLNKMGIYTVGEFINCDPTNIKGNNGYRLKRLIPVLRYKYLGEELINDVILEKEYNFNLITKSEPESHLEENKSEKMKRMFIDNNAVELRSFYCDLLKLGILSEKTNYYQLSKLSSQDRISYLIINYLMKENTNIISIETFLNQYLNDIYGELALRKTKWTTTKVEEQADLIKFYLEYIKEKKKKDEQEKDLPDTKVLENLKEQLLSLKALINNLDKKIEELQEQIALLEGGKGNGRH